MQAGIHKDIFRYLNFKKITPMNPTEYKHNTSNMRYLYYDTDNCFLIIKIIIIIIIGDFYSAHSKVRSALQYVQLKWL